MHRFRKRSEIVKTGQASLDNTPPDTSASEAEATEQEEAQFTLPSDFRTSLILPDLSRRFTLLRSTSGEPFALDTLRTKLAQQRARGAENQVTEEEEEMILSSFRFRSKSSNTPPQQSTEGLGPVTEDGSLRQSIQSTTTADSSTTSLYPSSITSSPTPSVRKGSKRYSNNLFGSGRLRDYSYFKTKNEGSKTQSVQSLTPSESSNHVTMSSTADSVRASSPENPTTAASTDTSPSPPDQTSPMQTTAYSENGEHVVSVAEYRISKSMGAAALKRASLALQQAIQELEEADADEILLPRSTPIPRTSLEQRASTPERKPSLSSASDHDTPMAISPEKHIQGSETADRRASPVSSRILPGYVPGMPRPMTPRDLDPEDLRSHSTTPRATSPNATTFVDPSGPSLPTTTANRARSGSTTSQTANKPPPSPLFLQRSTNGRFTPEDGRRPASPLSGTAYQSMSVNSRPSTPSNITWTVPPISKSLRGQGHSRNNSVASDAGGGVVLESHGRHTPGARSLRSPALPDSPMIDRMDSELSTSSTASSTTREDSYYRPESKVSLMELGSPMRGQRSPTPTQNAPRSPTAANFTRSASDRPTVQSAATSNLFNLGPVSPSIFSPLSNPSRTSLESEGSSYHSTGEEDKDRSYRLISEFTESKPAWHDLPKSDLQLSTSDDSTDDEWDPEEYIARYAGLKRTDFVAIQDKLVVAFKDRVERAPSAMRRRRPSTSQSNYSTKDLQALQVTGPPSQVQAPSSPTSPTPIITKVAPEATNVNASPERTEHPPASPGTLRNRELAKALFGGYSSSSQEALSQLMPPSPIDIQAIPINALNGHLGSNTSTGFTTPSISEPSSRNVSSSSNATQSSDEAKLAEVQQRIQAATMALKSPTSPSPAPLQSSGTISKKKIDPNQISSPKLVSASTSVDAVPIQRSPSLSSAQASSGTSKIGSRFKKLRGTLRAKNSPVAEDSGSHSPESRSASQAAHYEPEAPTKVTVTSPPTSAGPSLKGFMARLRGKQRATNDQPAASDVRLSPQPQRSTRAVSSSQQSIPKTPTSAISEADVFLSAQPREPATPQIQSAPPFQTSYLLPSPAQPQDQDLNDPLKQFFEAAEKIGIAPGELNALLARSNSTASRLPTRSDSLRRPQTPVEPDQSTPTAGQQTFRSETPDYRSNGNGTGTDSDATARAEKRSSRQGSRKAPDHLRLPREGTGNNAASTVIRRTIIFPESKMTPEELAALMGKSPIGRRRGSVTSTASRSIRDRAPTPPPPRSPTAKRFSHQSPPVPNLPPALGGPPATAAGPLEKSTSNCDSLYDMYSGENRSPSTNPNENDGPSSEPGAGVELIHLANGETIWNIVNGLRDDDDDYYNNRASFASEYSQTGTNEGGLQVYVKEKGHNRSTSKGSMASFVSRSKSGKRPETKVFWSPTANIGLLVENLSQHMDAGSFNFVPNRPPHGHTPSSSMSTNELNHRLEETLDEMIHNVRPS